MSVTNMFSLHATSNTETGKKKRYMLLFHYKLLVDDSNVRSEPLFATP